MSFIHLSQSLDGIRISLASIISSSRRSKLLACSAIKASHHIRPGHCDPRRTSLVASEHILCVARVPLLALPLVPLEG